MLTTPYGNIKVEFDGQETDYEITEILLNKKVWPDIAQGFLLRLKYIPDGVQHIIRCIIDGVADEVQGESGERLEMTSLYMADGKISIGVEADFGKPSVYGYDFGGRNLLNGIEIAVYPETKEQYFIFGVAWLDGVDEDTDVQTWFAADPTITGKDVGWNKNLLNKK